MKVKVWARVGMTVEVCIPESNDPEILAESIQVAVTTKLNKRIQPLGDCYIDGESYIPEGCIQAVDQHGELSAISIETNINLN